jgi:hypothetical protein
MTCIDTSSPFNDPGARPADPPHGGETWECTWQVDLPISVVCPRTCECEGQHGEIWAENGGHWITECGATAHATERGWYCDAGHEHIDMAVRNAEGWDYFDDDEVDAIRTGRFLPNVAPRDMQGRPV